MALDNPRVGLGTAVRKVAMKALVGAFVDAARPLVAGMPLPECRKAPRQAPVRLLGELEHKAVGRRRRALFTERDIELVATRQPGSISALWSAAFPVQFRGACLDRPASALRLSAGAGGRAIALDLLRPLDRAKLDRDWRQVSFRRSHAVEEERADSETAGGSTGESSRPQNPAS